MTDAQASTPRLSHSSSTDSPRSSDDQTPTGRSQQDDNPKFNLNSNPMDDPKIRNSSPESDALASSEDESSEQRKGSLFPPTRDSGLSQASRRPSYAAEFHTRQRRLSSNGGGPLSPTSSNPTTPSGDTALWAAGAGATPTTGTGMQSGAGLSQSLWAGSSSIWNQETSRKSPPKPLSTMAPNAGGPNVQSPSFFGGEALPSPTSLPSSDFPIPIPLQPSYRNYRSMSFSVGQMEQEEPPRQGQRRSPPTILGGPRPHPALQHRPSRPSLLGEEPYTGAERLGMVSENAEDEDSGKPMFSSSYVSQQSNAMRSKYEALKARNRSASAATIPHVPNPGLSPFLVGDGERMDDSALAEEEEAEYPQYASEQRRFSEAPRGSSLLYTPSESNQRLDILRRQHWQSGGPAPTENGFQSRRHSFAALPMTEEPEPLSPGEVYRGRGSIAGEGGISGLGSRDSYLTEENRLRGLQFSKHAISPSSEIPPSQPVPQMGYGSTRRPSPPSMGAHRGMMNMPPGHHLQQPRSQQLLFFVTFKDCRGDVFYVQEGTGLSVREGDLVIVEADRGTDLGTVIAENISWAKARELKDLYAEKQYQVLMMYAQRRPGTATTGTVGGPGAMPGHGQGPGQEGNAEIKPKMIKRLAQPHEIQTLRDKEANEAKAKRVCQTKVHEHRLPMEILDAEFQMDWKKLTFYYFADSYINFNPLVTDLFKVYKTRIWMSAMNPASFAHPAPGMPHQGPPGPPIPQGPMGPVGDVAPDMLHSQYPQFAPQYQSFPPSIPGSLGSSNMPGIMSGLQRAMPHSPQPTTPHSTSDFPNRHSPHSSEFSGSPHQPNGYGGHFPNGGVPGFPGHQPRPFGNDIRGMNDLWGNVQSLSLNSH